MTQSISQQNRLGDDVTTGVCQR